VEALRRGLLAGVYAGGSRLVQSEVAAQLGVSNTPVREAMRQLAAEGLLQFDRYRGFVVHMPTEAEIRELYELRLLLEPVAISKAARYMTDAELARARELHSRAKATTELEDWVVLNRQFHGALIDGAHSPRLSSIVGSLKDIALTQAWLFITSPQQAMEESNAEHAELLHVVETRDPERAARLVSRHLQAALRTIGGSTRAQTQEDPKGPRGR